MSTMMASRQRALITRAVIAACAIALLTAMALNTRVLSSEESVTASGETFSAVTFADENYSDLIVPAILADAVPATELYAAITADLDAAGDEFGGRDGTSAWAFPVTFTGMAGEVNPVNGQLPVTVDGIPDTLQIIAQMGPAINGSALRDVTGEISFSMFMNQIEFQSVSAELNNQAKVPLAELDGASLAGQTITVTGAFSYGNPSAWIVTPVQIEVGG